jgi:hypothetical protein
MERVKSFVESGLPLVVGIVGLVFSVLAAFGVDLPLNPLQQSSQVGSGNSETILVGLVSLVLVMQAARSLRSDEAFQRALLAEQTGDLLSAFGGLSVRRFSDATEYWTYAQEAINNAQQSIDDLTWGVIPTSQTTAATTRAYRNYRKSMEEICRGKGRHQGVIYREIMSFPDGYRIGRARALMKSEFTNFHLRYYDYEHDGTPRLVQFFVIDREEILLGLHPHSEAARNGYWVALRSPEVASIFDHYFDQVWNEGLVLKSGQSIESERLDEIAERFDHVHN